MILHWSFAGSTEDGEPLYQPSDRATRRWRSRRIPFGPMTRAAIHDVTPIGDAHVWPMPMGCGDEPAPVPSEVACNRCNVGRRLGVHPCPRCGCYEYRMLVRIEEGGGR